MNDSNYNIARLQQMVNRSSLSSEQKAIWSHRIIDVEFEIERMNDDFNQFVNYQNQTNDRLETSNDHLQNQIEDLHADNQDLHADNQDLRDTMRRREFRIITAIQALAMVIPQHRLEIENIGEAVRTPSTGNRTPTTGNRTPLSGNSNIENRPPH